jgi:hypothetical protein
MAEALQAIGGIVLICMAFIFFIYALPSLSTTTDVTTDTWKNSSTPVKSGVSFANGAILIFPALMFFGGMAITIKSLSG